MATNETTTMKKDKAKTNCATPESSNADIKEEGERSGDGEREGTWVKKEEKESRVPDDVTVPC